VIDRGDDELAKALRAAQLARALEENPISVAAAKLDMSTADFLRMIAGMIDRLTTPSPTIH